MDREDFQTWLESFPPLLIIGYARSATLCPVARWLNWNNPPYDHVVLSDNVRVYHYGKLIDVRNLPEWAQQYVDAVDECGKREVTAMLARSLLK